MNPRAPYCRLGRNLGDGHALGPAMFRAFRLGEAGLLGAARSETRSVKQAWLWSPYDR